MLLSFFGRLPPGDRIWIKVDGRTRTLCGALDGTPQVVSFFIEEKKQYEVELFQPLARSNRTLLFVVLSALTLWIQGIVHLLRFDLKARWYDAVSPYRVRAKLLVDMQRDTDIHIDFINARYDARIGRWSASIFSVKPGTALEVAFSVNHRDFGNRYFCYARKILSVAALALPAPGFLLYAAVLLGNMFAALFSLLMLLGLVLGAMAVCIREYRRLLALYRCFLIQDRTAPVEGVYTAQNPSRESR